MSKNGEKNICYVNGEREEGGYLKIERLLVVSALKQENKEIHEDSGKKIQNVIGFDFSLTQKITVS